MRLCVFIEPGVLPRREWSPRVRENAHSIILRRWPEQLRAEMVDLQDLQAARGFYLFIFGERPGEILQLFPVENEVADEGEIGGGDDSG